MRIFYLFLLSFFLLCCKSNGQSIAPKDYAAILSEREKSFTKDKNDGLGDRVANLLFNVRTENKKDFPAGIVPGISLARTDEDVRLIDKDKVVLAATEITVVIDYPLTQEYTFSLSSKKGFTKKQLLSEVRKNYVALYAEEEATATVKTIPLEKRTGMINRNQTNGKYGVWGHDIADLYLSGIIVYKNKEGKIFLSLDIES